MRSTSKFAFALITSTASLGIRPSSVVMMIFISTYTMVDGYFVSNYVGKTAFTAVNLIFPAIMVFACVGFMFGAGGSALVAKTMGEGQTEKANRLFSLIVLSAFVGGILLSALGYFLSLIHI